MWDWRSIPRLVGTKLGLRERVVGLEVNTHAWSHLAGVRRDGGRPGGQYPGLEALSWG